MGGISRSSRKLLTIMGLVLLVMVLAVPSVQAFEGRGGDVVIIGADEVIDDDLYVAAGEFTLDGTVRGDLFAVGQTIRINGSVEGDIFVAGQEIVVNGMVEEDAYAAGYAITLGGDVTEDFFAVGFGLENRSESTIGGDLLFGGYQALLEGDVSGTVDIGGGAVRLAGAIGGNANIDVSDAQDDEGLPPGFPFIPMLPTVPSVPSGLTVESSASIGNDLNYTANTEVSVPSGVVAGDVNFTRYVAPEPEEKPEVEVKAPSPAVIVGRWFLRQFRRLLTFLLVGAAMMWLVPDWTRKLAKNVETKPLPSLGWGVVAIVAFVVVMGVLVTATIMLAVIFGVVTLGELAGRFAVLGGIVTTSVGFGFSLLWRYVTNIVISLLLGQLIFRLFKSPAEHNRWWPLVVGVVIFVAITAIPILGWLARLATVLLGLGAIWLWGRDWWRSRQAAPVIAESETEAEADV